MKVITWKDLNQASKETILDRCGVDVRDQLHESVRDIIQKVRQQDDAALRYYTELFDGILLDSIKLKSDAWQVVDQLDANIKQAIEFAYENIRRFHELQVPSIIALNKDGVDLWKEYRSIESVGLYIPGGSAPLISTLLMLAIPASLAGCQQIIVTTPPSKDGSIHPAILYAAKLCGINQLYQVGGAQAIAALAYGTESIPKVVKIFGPGNKYVTEAKLQVAQDPRGAALDMPAGPSEVLVIADDTANPSFVASDLLAQAEHDEDAKAILVTTSQELARRVTIEIEEQTKVLGRRTILDKSLLKGLIIIASNLDEAFAISNAYAPEHLILQIENPRNYLSIVQNAGSVFIGPWSSEALGDYVSGTNHVLPTYGYAKSYGGLGVESFMKSITFQEVSRKGLLILAQKVEILADLEGLDAHKMSVSVRRKIIEERS